MYQIEARVVVESATVQLDRRQLARLAAAWQPFVTVYDRLEDPDELIALDPVGSLLAEIAKLTQNGGAVVEMESIAFQEIKPLTRTRILQTQKAFEATLELPRGDNNGGGSDEKDKPLFLPERLRDREWLHQKYIVEGLSTNEIGRLVGRTGRTVCTWLEKHGIPARPFGRKAGGEDAADPLGAGLADTRAGRD